MIRFSSARIWTMALAVSAAVALATGQVVRAQAVGSPPADFGTAPSGEIPILFNDHHVYSKPDKLRQNRVLAALVRKGSILVPLRSLFEQMGATVSYDKSSRSVDVSKPGADVKVTLGKPIVTINGEDRPLDVPPEMYKGAIVVPLRVLSEGMGAYVQWIGDKRLVVVRYFEAPAPTAPPSAPATATPTLAPTTAPTAPPTPVPTAKPKVYDRFVAADYDIAPIVYNEISPGSNGNNSFEGKAGIEFPAGPATLLVQGTYRHLQYDHNSNIGNSGCIPGDSACGTVVGSTAFQTGLCPSTDPGCINVFGAGGLEAYNGLGQAYVPGFQAREDQGTAGIGIKVLDPRIYLSVGGFYQHFNYLGVPNLKGIGGGLDKLPDFEAPFSIYGSVWYFPDVSGNYTYPNSPYLGPLAGATIPLSYNVLKYNVGAAIDLGKSPFYLDLGYSAEKFHGKASAPSDATVSSPFAGLGLHF